MTPLSSSVNVLWGLSSGERAPKFSVAPGFLVVAVESSKTALYGTSLTAPIVSGYAAILGSKFTAATPTQIASQLLATARQDTIANYNAAVHGRGEASIARLGTRIHPVRNDRAVWGGSAWAVRVPRLEHTKSNAEDLAGVHSMQVLGVCARVAKVRAAPASPRTSQQYRPPPEPAIDLIEGAHQATAGSRLLGNLRLNLVRTLPLRRRVARH